jgi:hypothetical protein
MADHESTSRETSLQQTDQEKNILHALRNNGVKRYLANLTPNPDTNHSLWKATRKTKHPPQHISPLQLRENTWARTDKQKAMAFAEHHITVFLPFTSQLTASDEELILHKLHAPHQMEFPLKKIRSHVVVQTILRQTHSTKSPGYDLITGRMLKELSHKGIRAITQIYNAILRLE